MAKTATNAVIDALLEHIADNGDIMFLCSSQPTTYTEASVTYKLADIAMTEGDGNGDYTIADAAGGGRKVTITQQANETVDSSGTATYLAIADSVGLVLLVVTTVTSQSLTAGNTVTVQSFTITVGDPT